MICEVVIDLSTDELDRLFDYEGDAEPGSRVIVPFGNKKMLGFVVGVKEHSDFKGDLKKIIKVLDTPLKREMLELMLFMREKFNLRYVDALRLFIPGKLRDDADADLYRFVITLNESIDTDKAKETLKRAKKQLEAFEYLLMHKSELFSKLSFLFGAAAINALVEKGICEKKQKEVLRKPFDYLKGNFIRHKLTDAQDSAVNLIEKGGKFLLHGVTGSGKTLVYITAIEKAVERGKSAIFLVPEISLTPQILKQLRARFGDMVAILHSGLSDGERFDEWKRLYRGEAKIAVGARSAIFAPLSDLGLIVIDEEHDSSYISDSNPRYDTKDIAFKRAEMCGASVVLGSATPSIETYRSALTGGLTLIELIDRISSCLTPEVEIIDMTKEIRMGNSGIFSVALKEALEQTIERGEQAMIFINRRGFSSFIMCAECGYTPMCSDCDVSLTYHRDVNRLKCHYCGKNYTVPQKCPKCGGTKLRHGRTGTEKVVLEIEKLFPKAKVIRMDNDTTARKGSVVKILEAFGKGEYNVLVGTQMIAKGHDFPLVTLVGILDADFSLYFDDYRSAERTFQLVTQVAGRAGRADRPGRVLLQTYAPRSYVFYFASKNDYRGFYLKEANTREVTKFPPFSKIVRVLCSSEDEKEAFEATKRIYLEIKNLEKDGGFIYLNAMKSPVNRIKNKVRYQVLMRLSPERADEIIKKVYDITNNNHGKASCFVELNPQSLF